MLTKGSSLETLKQTNLKEQVPEYSSVDEKFKIQHGRVYGKWGPFTIRIADVERYKSLGKEYAMGDKFVGFDSREQGQREVDRVLGIFSKRRGEAAMRSRAPGRRATMLTTGY